MKLKNLKKGDYFLRKPGTSTVLVRGSYCRELKKYSCYYFDDVNHEIFLKGETSVFVDFEF